MANSSRDLPAIDRWILGVTSSAHRHPGRFLVIATFVAALTWGFASGLKIRGDFVLLLPSKSETAQRFRNALARKGSDATTLVVLVESERPDANQRFVDALSSRLATLPPDTVGAIEKGPAQTRAFFERWRWLFADLGDLTRIECELERESARRQPGYVDLDEPCEERASAEASVPTTLQRVDAERSPLAKLRDEYEKRRKELDRYPTGYYRTEDGSVFAIVIRLPSSGLGEEGAAKLLEQVESRVAGLDPASSVPPIKVGYGGDVPNAIAERNALIEDVTVVSAIAGALIVLAITLYFRSLAALPLLTFSVIVASGVAFAIGRTAYGHLNAATSFLGSIIAGNGINYSIVYLARYRERRALGDGVEAALVDAAKTCRGATWLAALASGGAYATLLFTNFRGFSEFGLIGGAGMLLCWCATFSVTPAAITAYERILIRWSRARAPGTTILPKPRHPFVFRFVGRLGERYPLLMIGFAAVVTAVLSVKVVRYLEDPWEYDFSKLGSRSSAERGAGYWSVRADRVFASRGAPILVLANDISETLGLAASIRERDRSLTGGRYVEQVVTIHDRLGGSPEVVNQKLELLAKIRAHIDRARKWLEPADARIADDLRPPEYLRAVTPADLPPLVRAQFSEKDGTVGTPVFVYLNRGISQSKGQHLLAIAEIIDGVRLPSGAIPESASRASVFSEMIRSMAQDGPVATALALMVVILAAIAVTRRALPSVAIIASLVCGVVWTIGWAAASGIRLNFLNFVALPLTFGIGVDYAINLFERVRFSGWNVAEGVASVGGAVFLCSVTTMVGYGALLFADNRALQSFGHYALRGEIACSVAALLVMPGVLGLLARHRARTAP